MRIEFYFCTIKACVSHVFTLVSPEWFALCACVSVCLFYFSFFLRHPIFPSSGLSWSVIMNLQHTMADLMSQTRNQQLMN